MSKNDNVIGQMPEFSAESTPVETKEIPAEEPEKVAEESSAETTEDTPVEKETETPESDPPADEQPAAIDTTQPSVDTRDLREELFNEIEGLKAAKKELIHEVKDLRGQKREAKEAELEKVQEKIDDLKDVNPDDVNLIDRILKAKGYVSREEVTKMQADNRKQDQIDKFFRKYPEYSEENDPDRRKFGPLLREVSLYKEPSDPLMWGKLLEKAHNTITYGTGKKSSSERSTTVAKRQVEVAGVGSGGAQRSSSVTPFTPERRSQLKSWGWSDADIKGMEERKSNQE